MHLTAGLLLAQSAPPATPGDGAPWWVTILLGGVITVMAAVAGKITLENRSQRRERDAKTDTAVTTTFVESSNDVIAWWRDVVNQATDTAKAAEAKAAALEAELATARQALDRSNDETDELREQHEIALNRVRSLTTQIEGMCEELDALRAELREWRQAGPS